METANSNSDALNTSYCVQSYTVMVCLALACAYNPSSEG